MIHDPKKHQETRATTPREYAGGAASLSTEHSTGTECMIRGSRKHKGTLAQVTKHKVQSEGARRYADIDGQVMKV